MKLAVFTSHPIQYYVPLFKRLNQEPEIDLRVYFYSKHGLEISFDPEFGQSFKWDTPLLEGYQSMFLKNYSSLPGFHFFSFINISAIREIFKQKPDVVLIHSWSYCSDWLVIIAAILSKTSLFLRVENPLRQEVLKRKWKLWLKKIILGKILFPQISAFLYIGQENKKFYQFYGVPEKKLFFTPYAVDNERFIDQRSKIKNQNGKSRIKEELGIESKKTVILFAGKLITKKRPMDLVKAYEIIKTENKALIFVGAGALRSEIEEYIEQHKLKDVYLVGFKNQTEIPKYYALADILVLPSEESETWGLVVNEAMCFGLPVIVSDTVGCAADLVQHGHNGYIYPVGDITQLANYLEKLVKDKNKRKTFGEKSFELIQNYSYEENIKGILRALSLLKR